MDCYYEYTDLINPVVYLEEDQIGYVKFYLEPGYYEIMSAGVNVLGEQYEKISWLTESLEPMVYTTNLMIVETGYYYLEIDNSDSNEMRTSIDIFQLPEMWVGTVNEPSLVEKHVVGALGEPGPVTRMFFVDGALKDNYIQFYFGESNHKFNWRMTDGSQLPIWGNEEQYMLANAGTFAFLDLVPFESGTTYDVIWQYIPFDDFETEFAKMPELHLGENIIGIGSPDNEVNYRFQINQAGTYHFENFDWMIAYGSIEPYMYELFTQDGTSLGGNYELNDIDLEPGSYYISSTIISLW